jgi:hypothetical protein
MARTGMANLITRLRSMTNAGTVDFTLDATSYFSDAHLQDILDANVTWVHDVPLTWQIDTIGGGSIEYKTCWAGNYRDYEEWGSGTAYWAVRDGPGAFIGTANYTPDYVTGRITFSADQGGTAYYLTARSYDLYNAAADVWQRRQSFYSYWYDFQSDDQKFSRKQAFDNAVAMERQMRQRAGQNANRGDFRVSSFFRTDVNRSEA